MKSSDQNAKLDAASCCYCVFWKGTKSGCVIPHGYCVLAEDKLEDSGGIAAENKESKTQNPKCVGCPYGRDYPCIGWCTKDVLQFVGLTGG